LRKLHHGKKDKGVRLTDAPHASDIFSRNLSERGDRAAVGQLYCVPPWHAPAIRRPRKSERASGAHPSRTCAQRLWLNANKAAAESQFFVSQCCLYCCERPCEYLIHTASYSLARSAKLFPVSSLGVCISDCVCESAENDIALAAHYLV
jgi:hypothetical protein